MLRNITTSVRYVLFSEKRGYLEQNQPTYQYSGGPIIFTSDLDRARQYITPQGTINTKSSIGGDLVLRKINITMVEENTDDSVTFAAEYAEYKELLNEAKTIGLDEMVKARFKRLRAIEGMFGWKKYRRPVIHEGTTPTREGVLAILEKKYGT
jgi:hypothetical protein